MKENFPAALHPLHETLHQLWTSYLNEPRWVPLDRWLSVQLRALPRLNRRQRLWLGRQLLDACRLALCVLFCQFVFDHSPKGREEDLDQNLPDLARRMAETMDPPHIKSELRSMGGDNFFFWLRLRRSGLGLSEAENDPQPGPRHHSARARRLWPGMARCCQASRDLLVRLLWHGLPPSLLPHFQERSLIQNWGPEESAGFLAHQALPPAFWLRLNKPQELDRLQTELRSKGFTIQQEQQDALQVSGQTGLYELEAYRQGVFEIQDLASQEIGRVVDLFPGQFVWDCCAGTGGKSLQLAARLQGKGALYASDLHQKKLDILRLRARRAGLGNSLRTLPWSGEELPSFGREIDRHGGFDRVLLDAPCSGSGTWRLNPDGRLDFTPQRLPRLLELQQSLFSTAAKAVRPGGMLVYATCSFLACENESQVDQFLSLHSEFRLLKRRMFGSPEHDSDSTFAAILLRQAIKVLADRRI